MIFKWLGLVWGQRSYILWHPMTALYWQKLLRFEAFGCVLFGVFFNNSVFALGCKMYAFGLYLSNAD